MKCSTSCIRKTKFRILLDDQVKLSPEAVGKMTSLHVRLNTCSCVTNHTSEDPLGRCADCHRKCKRGPDPPLSDKSDLDAAVLQRWSNFCKARGGTLKPEMRFTVICDCVDVAAAKQVVQPMQSFPKLTECAIRLGQSPEMDLRQIAEDTVLKLTHNTPVARSKPFRFLDLPKELQRLILWHTDLVASSSLHCHTYWGVIPVLRSTDWQERHQWCCMRCTDAGEACCCALNHAAYSSTPCVCWRFPSSLFLVNKEFNKEATKIFFSANHFVIWGESWDGINDGFETSEPAELTLFQRLSIDVLKHLRSIQFNVTGGESLERWGNVIEYASPYLDTSKLTVGLECRDYEPDGRDFFGLNLSREDIFEVFRTIASMFQFKTSLKDFFVHLPLPNESGVPQDVCEDWERKLEVQVMGLGYDAEARGKYDKRSYSITESMRLPEPVYGSDGSVLHEWL